MPKLVSGASTGVFPSCAARGMASKTSLSAATSWFDYFTGWTTTDVNNLGLLTSGGYCEVPAGFGGLYQVTFFINGITSNDYNTAAMYSYDGSSYELLFGDYAFNDYSNYTCGGTVIVNMKAGDRLYCGYDDRYGTPSSSDSYSRMSMHFINH